MSAEDREAMLKEAITVVTQDRNREYGGPEDSFGLIANYWTVLFGIHITPVQVALALDLLKTARLQANPYHRDSWVDKAGYAACGLDVSMLAKVDAKPISPSPTIAEFQQMLKETGEFRTGKQRRQQSRIEETAGLEPGDGVQV